MGVIAVGVVVPIFAGLMLGGPVWVIAVVAMVAGWRFVPGFLATVVAGALGGVFAGILVLGPGLRLAMRVVAILDPIRTPEFTVEGTLFIVILIGAIFGGTFGLAAILFRRAFALSGRTMALWVTGALMAVLLVDTELRGEFVDLGAGPWLNIPMFAGVVFLYALVAGRVTDRLLARKSGLSAQEPVEVQA
jgi:hypothetical protein